MNVQEKLEEYSANENKIQRLKIEKHFKNQTRKMKKLIGDNKQ